MSDMGGLGIGSMQEAGRKMQAQVNESEARRGRPGGPHHEPPSQGRLLQAPPRQAEAIGMHSAQAAEGAARRERPRAEPT